MNTEAEMGLIIFGSKLAVPISDPNYYVYPNIPKYSHIFPWSWHKHLRAQLRLQIDIIWLWDHEPHKLGYQVPEQDDFNPEKLRLTGLGICCKSKVKTGVCVACNFERIQHNTLLHHGCGLVRFYSSGLGLWFQIGFHVWSKCIWFWVQLTVTTKRSIFLERVAQPRTSTNNCSTESNPIRFIYQFMHTAYSIDSHPYPYSYSYQSCPYPFHSQFYPFSLLPSPYRFTPSESLVLFGSQIFSRALKKWAVAAKLLLMISSGIENYQKKWGLLFRIQESGENPGESLLITIIHYPWSLRGWGFGMMINQPLQ